MKFKLTCFAILGAVVSFVIFSSQQQVTATNPPAKKESPTLTSVNISLKDAESRIHDKLSIILNGYNEAGVAGGVAVYGVTKNSSMSEPTLTVQFYHGSVASNPNTTAVLWSNAQAAASSANYSVAFPLADKSNAIVGYVVVGSSSRPDLDQQAIMKALLVVKGVNPLQQDLQARSQAEQTRSSRSFR
ncbi:MAG: hypothetical protein P4L16_03185 [Chlamydiales bacterium]|nr:hypothetical protein [Chlamydiales bacterium]